MKLRAFICFLLLPAAVPAAPPADAPATPLDEAIASVIAANPGLQSRQAAWEAMRQQSAIVGALPDPMLTYGYYLSRPQTRVGAAVQNFSLSQKLPFPGRRALVRTQADQAALRAYWRYESAIREAVLQTKLACDDLWRVAQTRRLLADQLELYRATIAAARARYESGRAGETDVLQAQLAAAELARRAFALDGEQAAALARLNALRDAPPGAPFAPAASLNLPALPPLDSALALAQDCNQELRAAAAALAEGQTSLALAQKDRRPDFTVGVDYGDMKRYDFINPPGNGMNDLMVSVGVNLPVWRARLRAEERQARLNLDARRSARRDTLNTVAADVRSAWFQAQSAADQKNLLEKTLLPQARQTYAAALRGYETAQTGFLDLLDSERTVLTLRLGLLTSETNLADALARLERAIGAPLAAAEPPPQSDAP